MTDKIVTTQTRIKYQAGRPKLSRTEPTVSLHITVKASQADFLREYGFDNASNGVRRLVDEKREGTSDIEERRKSHEVFEQHL